MKPFIQTRVIYTKASVTYPEGHVASTAVNHDITTLEFIIIVDFGRYNARVITSSSNQHTNTWPYMWIQMMSGFDDCYHTDLGAGLDKGPRLAGNLLLL